LSFSWRISLRNLRVGLILVPVKIFSHQESSKINSFQSFSSFNSKWASLSVPVLFLKIKKSHRRSSYLFLKDCHSSCKQLTIERNLRENFSNLLADFPTLLWILCPSPLLISSNYFCIEFLQEMSGPMTDKKIRWTPLINSSSSFHSLDVEKISFESKSVLVRKRWEVKEILLKGKEENNSFCTWIMLEVQKLAQKPL